MPSQNISRPSTSTRNSRKNNPDDHNELQKSSIIFKSNTPISLNSLAQALDRYAIASSVLVDIGLISSESNNNVIDRNKVRRARDRIRKKEIASTAKETIFGLYFDERKDKFANV